MSCYVCHKRKGTTPCSRADDCAAHRAPGVVPVPGADDCANWICDGCKNQFNTGGMRWVECQNVTQWYCRSHLIKGCFECKTNCVGCTKCASAKKRGAFSLVTVCCVCNALAAKCGNCKGELPEHKYYDQRCEIEPEDDLNKCQRCNGYFCKPCGVITQYDMYDMDCGPVCNKCNYQHC